MQKFKGVTYQRKANEGPSTKNTPKVTIRNDANNSTNLGFYLSNWLVNAKIPVRVLELCKYLDRKKKLLKILYSPTDSSPSTPLEPLSNPPKPSTPKKATFSDIVEQTSNNVFVDPPVVLHTRDPRKKDQPPFYVSLMIGDLLPSILNLHNFYDPIGLWMEELCNRQSHPWHDFVSPNPCLSLIFKQQIRMASIFIHITSKPSLTCCIIYCKERQIDPLSEWLHWIYDFT